MADYRRMDGVPSWQQYLYAVEAGVLPAMEMEDPELTLMVQLTLPELAISTFGLMVVDKLFPELSPLATRLSEKLAELNQAQDYLHRAANSDSGEDDESE